MDSSTCPYCNALLPTPESSPSGGRLCPRCGEVLPARFLGTTAITTAPTAAPAPPAVAKPVRLSNRSVRGIVLGVMAAMALLALTFIWNTVAYRRARDPRPPRPTEAQAARPLPPAEWPALRFLPADTAIVAGLHVREVQQSAVSREVLKKLQFGANPVNGAELENWTGLTLDEIDHAVLGFKVAQRLIPPFVLVVQTRQPYDLAKVRSALKAERSSEVGKKSVYHFTPRGAKLSFDVMLWPAAPDTLVVCMTRADLDSIRMPPPAANPLPTPAQALLAGRVDAGAQAWLVGDVQKWDGVGTLLGLFLNKEAVETVGNVRTFAFGVQVDPGVQLAGAVRCSDEARTAQLAEQWAQLKLPEGSKEMEPVFKELTESYRVERQDGWLTLKANAKPETVAKAAGK